MTFYHVQALQAYDKKRQEGLVSKAQLELIQHLQCWRRHKDATRGSSFLATPG